ncbi:hypothetical protein LWI28_006567 [Acer negundo]|uniref:Integrase catalytic domain-containing protein n=1 Tax=Acer negundo TaxID=4023 RepID=A0AAD5ICH1_ACENE|nr:hypothetical protein LWI28_006567 [Acer negundo]
MQFDARVVEVRKKLEDHEGGVWRFRYKNKLLYYKNYVYVPGVPGLKEEILAHFHNSKEGGHSGWLRTYIPEKIWEDLTMDFVEGMLSNGGYKSILIVMDRLSKGAHFIPLKHPFTDSSVAKAFVDNMVKLHGIPRSIVTDRGKLFMSSFL